MPPGMHLLDFIVGLLRALSRSGPGSVYGPPAYAQCCCMDFSRLIFLILAFILFSRKSTDKLGRFAEITRMLQGGPTKKHCLFISSRSH